MSRRLAKKLQKSWLFHRITLVIQQLGAVFVEQQFDLWACGGLVAFCFLVATRTAESGKLCIPTWQTARGFRAWVSCRSTLWRTEWPAPAWPGRSRGGSGRPGQTASLAAQDSQPVQQRRATARSPGVLWFGDDGLIRRKQDEAQQGVIEGAQSGHQPSGALKSGLPAISGAGNMGRKLRKRSFCSLKRFFGNEV